MCLYCVGKVLHCFSKTCDTSWFPGICTIYAHVIKMAKFKKQLFCQKVFFCMTPLHAHAQYICIVYAKYQKDSVKALVQVDFPVYALSKQKQNKQTGKKMAKFIKLSFCKNLIFWHHTPSCNCSLCLHCVCKALDGFSKSSGTSWFPCACTIWVLTKPLLTLSLPSPSKNQYLSDKHVLFI